MTEDRHDFPKEECKNPDEIIVRDIDTFHMEMMDKDSLWIGLIRKDGQIDHLNVIVKGNKLDTLWSPRTGHMDPEKL
jgi:hypothetical protein